MAIYGGITPAQIQAAAQVRLIALRQAFEGVRDLHAWLSAYSPADLQAAPFNMTPDDATALFSAFADAAKLADLYDGGGLGSYTLPYDFSASQRKIIGPQY